MGIANIQFGLGLGDIRNWETRRDCIFSMNLYNYLPMASKIYIKRSILCVVGHTKRAVHN